MQRIELRNGGEPRDSGVAAERRVTLMFPATSAEYEEARLEVGSGAAAAPAGGRYVLTTDEQRRAWGLPDLANGAAARGTVPGEPAAAEGPDPVPVVDPAEAIDLLFEDDAGRSGAAAAAPEAGDGGGGGAAGARRRGRPGPAPFVNLKHNRGPIPEDLRATFSELCRQTRIDGLLESIDALFEPLERSVVPDLEAARRGIEALRRREVTPERLGDPGGEDPADERAERVARTCWVIERRLRKLDNALGRLDCSNLKISPAPPSFRCLLRQVEDDPVGNAPPEGILAACDQALRGFERAAGEAVDRIRAVAAARRAVEAGEWTYDALRRIRLVLGRFEEVRAVLDDDGVPSDQLERLRDGLKEIEKERRVTDPLATLTQDVLEQFEAAELPVAVLARGLDEIRRSQTASQEAAAAALERLRVVASLPWTARAAERIDIEAAMRELEAAYAGRPEIKARIRQFLATRRLTSTTWTVEGCARAAAGPEAACTGRPPVKARNRRFLAQGRPASTTPSAEGRCGSARSRRRAGSGPVAPRRLVVRPARRATRDPVLCFAGPSGCGKTALARLIAGALRRPAVTIALGGVWDESAIRGLPISFRSPEAGRIVRGLLDAKVRNPVMVLDEIDKVGGATKSFGDPSAALLELLDPEQNTHFRDVYVDVPVDLSEVLFIATANDLAGIPAPLRDRLEVIEASGYSDDEKVAIVRRRLWADQLEVNGLSAGAFWTGTPAVTRGEPDAPPPAAPGHHPPAVEVIEGELTAVTRPGEGRAAPPPPTAGAVEVTDAAIREVIRGHTCEAGVRELARQLGAVGRFVACRRVEQGDAAPVTVVADADEAARLEPIGRHITVAEVLGPPRYDSLPDHVRDALSRERARVTGLQPADPAAVAAAAWIEVVEELPWRRAEERLGSPAALRRAFDREHVGRDREKDQVIDHLVARRAAAQRHAAGAPADDAVILCLCGPPGIGRTAFARALAASLGRRFVRVSLAGVQDAAAVHGVARPAPDAAPGRLVRALRGLGSLPGRVGDNPLVVLGELDRLAEAAADAVLSAVDPARNHAFRDRYVGLPQDLGGVLFVAAATEPGRIPPLLRERLELLPLAGYTDAEKERIAAEHLIPGARRRHGLSGDDLSFSPAALELLICGYSREPGVRGLDGHIDVICRRGARLRTEGLPPPGEMTPETVAVWLGAPRFRDAQIAGRTRRPGVAVGLAATATGGEVLVVEAACLPGLGRLRVTGTAGPLLRESANVALTWVRANAERLVGVAGPDDSTDVHVHLAEAARSKDGASAGVALAVALVSAQTGRPTRGDIAMSGELTLAGTVEPVGGIREKVLGACRARMTAVVLPRGNEADIAESFGDEPPGGIRVCYARTMDDVLEVVLPGVVAATTAPPEQQREHP